MTAFVPRRLSGALLVLLSLVHVSAAAAQQAPGTGTAVMTRDAQGRAHPCAPAPAALSTRWR